MAPDLHTPELETTAGRDAASRSPRDLYLDLLIRILANTIYEDPATRLYLFPSVTPENMAPFSIQQREIGVDWPLRAHTMVGLRRLRNLRDLAQRTIDEGVPGDFIEAGVWRGGCCILMRGMLKVNAVTGRKVYVADSFAGLPPPNPERYRQDAGYDYSQHKDLAVSVAEVQANFARYGLLDDQVVFLEGFFQDTLPGLEAGPFALLRLDADLYESTHVALEHLYPKLSPGGFVIVDDYRGMPPCRQAVDDYRSKIGITAPMIEIDWSGVWWQKPAA
jgi:O-methyltransferase/8-demethyl-8-(2,3-dimethoxy-alpha-L-rhamnosyl)tetracenomycin-C 4'-O-methyltransferase